MKLKYIGKSFGVDSLTDGCIYDVVEVDSEIGAFRVIDDSGEDYLYSISNPKPIANPAHPGGRWEIVEDDKNETLLKAFSL